MTGPRHGRERLIKNPRTRRWEIQPPTVGRRFVTAARSSCTICGRASLFCICSARALTSRWAT